MKKAVILIVTFVVLLMCSSIALASEENNLIITPESSNVFLAYDASIGKSSTSIIAGTSSNLVYSTNQSIYMELQRWNGSSWIKVASWSDSIDSFRLTLRKTYPISPGKYRVTGKHTAGGETKYSYSNTLTIN